MVEKTEYRNNDGCPTPHKPIDTGLGFTCDEGVVEIVLAMNKIDDIKTIGSCEATGDWVIPRSYVSFKSRHQNHHHLLEVCLAIRAAMETDGWNQVIHVDNYSVPRGVFAVITYHPSAKPLLLQIIENIIKSSPLERSSG